jgi:hypothetical protein
MTRFLMGTRGKGKHKQGRLAAMVSYRHPVTSVVVYVPEGTDAELQCLEQGGKVAPAVLARMRELTGQSAQNRSRIQKRLFAEIVPPVSR